MIFGLPELVLFGHQKIDSGLCTKPALDLK
jgi:hypothetical protein